MRKWIPGVIVMVVAALALPVAAAEKVQLRLNVKEGMRRGVRITADHTITQTVQQTHHVARQKVETDYTYEVVKVEANGNAMVRTTYKTVRFMQEGPMGKVEYDSSRHVGPVPLPARPLASLPGASFLMTMSPEGEVLGVEGVGALLKKMLDSLELPPGAQSDVVRRSIEEQFGDEAIKEMMGKTMFVYSREPVSVGDSWGQTSVIRRVMPMIVQNTLTLKGREKGVARLDVNGTIKPNPEGTGMVIAGMRVLYELRGAQAGTVEVEEATGWPVRSRVGQRVAGEMKIGGQPGAPVVNIPVVMEGVVALETIAPD